MNRFTILKQLGRGTFGIVYRAYDNLCKRDVAIKQIAKSGDCINREIEILGTVKNNEFCVQILDIFYSFTIQLSQFIVFEYIPYTLRDFISKNTKTSRKKGFEETVKKICFKLLSGLMFIHSLNIVHRDFKPENILIDDCFSPDIVKICDFGSAKIIEEKNNPYVVSRFYRAPELIFGHVFYDKSIDIWAAGCIFIEMFTGRPVFESNSDIDLFLMQIKVLGKPNEGIIKNFAEYSDVDFQDLSRAIDDSKLVFNTCLKQNEFSQDLWNLITRMLNWDYKLRPSAKECLQHEFFSVK